MTKKIGKIKKPKYLNIDGQITKTGLNILINDESFPIEYPKEIWQKYSQNLKEILLDNLAYSSTIFLPQILNLSEINYRTARPLSESFLFKNGIYDMPTCAIADNQSS